MNRTWRNIGLSVGALVAIALALASLRAQRGPATPGGPADLVLRGGRVMTVDPQDRITSAVALTGNRIAATGSDQEIARFVGPDTRVIDLKGRTVTPGFNPEEAISPMQAIKMLTIWAAYGGFEEKVKGSIEVGKLAELAVLAGDPSTIAPERLAWSL